MIATSHARVQRLEDHRPVWPKAKPNVSVPTESALNRFGFDSTVQGLVKTVLGLTPEGGSNRV